MCVCSTALSCVSEGLTLDQRSEGAAKGTVAGSVGCLQHAVKVTAYEYVVRNRTQEVRSLLKKVSLSSFCGVWVFFFCGAWVGVYVYDRERAKCCSECTSRD